MLRGFARHMLHQKHKSVAVAMAPRDIMLHPAAGRMFSVQQSLPHLPVPPLEQTLQKYLLAIKPIVCSEDFEETKNMVAEFGKEGGVGEKLQTLLEARAKQHINWLEDWWLNTAYLHSRIPCVGHVNPAVAFPLQNFSDQQGQLRFAAKAVSGLLDYKVMIDNQTLAVEHMGKNPLCMVQYYKILNSCRIPGKKIDSVVTFAPDKPNPPKHIIVMHNNHIFSMEVYGKDGQPLPEGDLHEQLSSIVNQSTEPAPAIGILTSDNRNSWGKIYATMNKDKKNKVSFEEIHKGIFVLNLDQPMPHVSSSNDGVSPRLSQAAQQMNHGGGSRLNGGNRWFDKTLQIIVGTDGACGLNYEHSTAEGPPIMAMADHMIEYTKTNTEKKKPTGKAPAPKKLKFNITPEVRDAIEKSAERLDMLVDDLEMCAFDFSHFGKDFPKSAKMSPDAFLQISYQLAYYRLFKEHPATYESASLRRFQHGRTDTIRSCSIDSSNFAKAMDDNNLSKSEKVNLLRKAVDHHRYYTDQAISGQGIDRHLLGLKLTAIDNNMKVPDIYMDTSYQTAMHFRLSTSQVASKGGALLAFGPVVPDGFGVCYNPQLSRVLLGVSAWNSNPNTSAKTLAHTISDSLLDMKTIVQDTQ